MTLTKYVLIDEYDHQGDHLYDTFQEAQLACDDRHAIVELEFEYSDSSLVSTPCGCDDWPCFRHDDGETEARW